MKIYKNFFVEHVSNDSTEFPSDMFLVEHLEPHHRSVILEAEPTAALAFFGFAKIA